MSDTNNNGPIIEPCGTPDVTGKGDDTLPSITTDVYRSCRIYFQSTSIRYYTNAKLCKFVNYEVMR